MEAKMFDKCHTVEYHGNMHDERTVTTREFLRNFRRIKEQLLSGRLHVVHVVVDDHEELHVTPARPAKTLGSLLHAVEALPRPMRIRRTHIFDQLLRPRKR